VTTAGGAVRRSRSGLTAPLLLVLGLLVPPASAGGTPVTEVELSTPKAGPSLVAIADDGAVWASLARASKLLRLAPDGSQREYPLPAQSFPVGLAVEPGGAAVWYSDVRLNQIVRIETASGESRAFEVPTPDSWPFFLVRDHQGLLYFTERVGNKLGRLDPTTGTFDEFPVATPHAQPAGMTLTPDGHLFFTQNSANRVGHFDPSTGRLEDIEIPSPASPGPYYGPAGIASDAAGDVWFAELDGRLGRIRRAARDRVDEFTLPDPRWRPGGVAVDRWGLVWFTGLDGNLVGNFDPELQVFRSYPLPSGAPDSRPMSPPEISARGEAPVVGMVAKTTRPFGIAAAATGRVWFAEQYGHRLGYVDPPVLDPVSPAGVLVTDTVPVVTRLRREAEGARLAYRLDGEPVTVGGSLDLALLSPGTHRWQVTATSAGGASWSAETDFVTRPSLAVLERSLSAVGGREMPVEQALRDAREHIKSGRTDLARVKLRAAVAAATSGADLPERVLLQAHYLDLFGPLESPVTLTEEGCRPAEVVVQVGDLVAWRRTGGDEPLRVVATDGTFASPPLAGDESWLHHFTREGRFEVLCGSASPASVTVVPRKAGVTEIPMPGPGRIPTVLAFDHRGNLWFAAGGGGYASLADVPLNNKIGRLAPDGTLSEYDTPTPESAPTSLKVAPDGSVWFTLRAVSKLGHLDPDSGVITEIDLPTPNAGPTGLAIAKDGTVWFTEKLASKVGRLDPATGRIQELETPHQNAEPSTVVIDHEGSVWFDERAADNLVRMDPATGELTQFGVPTKGSRVIGLVPDPRGYMWFLELAGQKVGRLNVETGQVVELAIPTPFASPFKAVLDDHGRLWFTQAYGNKVAVVENERLYEFELPSPDSMPGGIEIGPDGGLWFTEQAGNRLAHLPLATRVYAPVGGR